MGCGDSADVSAEISVVIAVDGVLEFGVIKLRLILGGFFITVYYISCYYTDGRSMLYQYERN